MDGDNLCLELSHRLPRQETSTPVKWLSQPFTLRAAPHDQCSRSDAGMRVCHDSAAIHVQLQMLLKSFKNGDRRR
jgi:hypothetical protein